jgi:hypothetical protein
LLSGFVTHRPIGIIARINAPPSASSRAPGVSSTLPVILAKAG